MVILQVEVKEVVEGKCTVNFSHDGNDATPTETNIVQHMMRGLTSLLQPQAPNEIIIPGR